MTKDEMITLLQSEFKSLATKFESDDFTNACNDAERDTGWDFPAATDFKVKWMKQRAKRHLFFMLLTVSASQVKTGAYNLNQRFEHYIKLIKDMDEAFEAAKGEDPAEFAGVGAVHLFGTKIDAGFKYEPQTGRDLTYDEDNIVILNPDEDA